MANGTPNEAFPAGTKFEWVGGAPSTATPGIVEKKVKVTLPPDANGTRISKEVPVNVTVKPQAPQISDDQLTEKGGLPNRSIEVTNVTPGATVTLTIGDKTFPPKVVPADATSVTFGADELADANGLLPKGTVTATQTKVVTNPEGNPETLSTSTTKEITKETEKPNVEVVLQVKDKNNNWVERPKTAVRNDANRRKRTFCSRI